MRSFYIALTQPTSGNLPLDMCAQRRLKSHWEQTERKAITRNRCKYLTPSIQDTERKEGRTKSNDPTIKTLQAKGQKDSFFPKHWPNRFQNNNNTNHQDVHVKKTYNDRNNKKKVREKSRECHNHKPQPFPDPKRKRKPTNLNKHKPNERTKSTKISSLFPKRGNRNTKRTEKHKNKMTHGKTYNKSPRRINHKATRSKTNTGTTALERSAEQTTGGFKALLQLANFTLGPDS